jgi:hypothetical protein
MPIQINGSGSFEIPSKTYDSVWITNISIVSMSPTQRSVARISVCPWNTSTNEIDKTQTKTISIPDVFDAATSSSYVATAMQNIFAYTQQCVISGSLF